MAIPKRKRRTSDFDLLTRQNIRFAKSVWPEEINSLQLSELRTLSRESGLALTSGEILLLDGRWYVTSAGLLRLAKNRGCRGIHTRALEKFSDPRTGCWVFKATVYKGSHSKGFVGYGDADPSNVSPLVRGAEMRVAETRAVNRALRKAYGIGLCSVEELGSFSASPKHPAAPPQANRLSRIERLKQWSAPLARSTLPADPPAQPRSNARESLRRRFLRYTNPERSRP